MEGDASSASYFLAGAAITGGSVTVEGCGSDSLQGDVAFATVLERMGAAVAWTPTSVRVTGPPRGELKGVDADCVDIPDAAMTLAVAALFARGPTTIRNVGSWRVKETERMKFLSKKGERAERRGEGGGGGERLGRERTPSLISFHSLFTPPPPHTHSLIRPSSPS